MFDRGSGKSHTADSYVADGLPVIDNPPGVEFRTITGAGDSMVVSYELLIDATVDGATMTRRAPRLTIFRKIDDAWFVSAHANFALLEL